MQVLRTTGIVQAFYDILDALSFDHSINPPLRHHKKHTITILTVSPDAKTAQEGRRARLHLINDNLCKRGWGSQSRSCSSRSKRTAQIETGNAQLRSGRVTPKEKRRKHTRPPTHRTPITRPDPLTSNPGGARSQVRSLTGGAIFVGGVALPPGSRVLPLRKHS